MCENKGGELKNIEESKKKLQENFLVLEKIEKRLTTYKDIVDLIIKNNMRDSEKSTIIEEHMNKEIIEYNKYISASNMQIRFLKSKKKIDENFSLLKEYSA